MNSTDRVMAAVAFQPPDRVPYWDTPWGGFEDAWRRHFHLSPDVHAADYYHSDIVGEICPNERFFASREGPLREENGFVFSDNGWGWLVRTPKDQRAFFTEKVSPRRPGAMTLDDLQFDPPLLASRFQHIPAQVKREQDAGRCFFAKTGGIYCRTQFLYGAEDLLADMMLAPERVHRVMAQVADYLTTMAQETLRISGAWQTGLWICDDMAGRQAPMFSPECFANFLLPLYKTMLKTVRAAGCRHVFFHSDGNIGPFLDLLLEAGFEGFNPLEPRCGLDLISLKRQYGNRMVLFGGVCNTEILPRGNRREIEAHVRPLLELARDGGVVLGCASIGSDVTPECYDYYRKLIDKYA